MRKDKTTSGNTGSLPKGMQFLQHGTPGPRPSESPAELERAEQAEYILFQEEAAPEPEVETVPYTVPEEPEYDLVEGQTASIARIVASVFADAKTDEDGDETEAPAEKTGYLTDPDSDLDAFGPLSPEDFSETDGTQDSRYAVQPMEMPANAEAQERAEEKNFPEYSESPAERDHRSSPEPAYSPENAVKPESAAGAGAPGSRRTNQAQSQPQSAAGTRKQAAKAQKPGTAKQKKTGKKSAAKQADSRLKISGIGAAPLPGTGFVKISDSNVRDQASFRQMLQDIRQRQQEALPSQNASVKQAMKRAEKSSGAGRMMNPVRCIIIGLMVLCLAGRRFQWMTLGIMDGMQGTRISIVLTLISMLVSWQSAKRSLKDIMYLKPSYETWLLAASILTSAEALLHSNASSLMPILTIAWCFSGIADAENSQTQARTDKAFRKAKSCTGLRVQKGSKKNRTLIGKAKASTYGFVRHQAEPDVFHKIWMLAGPVLFILMLILTAFINGRTGKNFLTILVLMMDIATPAALALCCSRPYALFSVSTRRHGVVSGWYGMQQLAGHRYLLLYDSDFYPGRTIRKKDVRLYMPIDINTMITYAASLGLKGKIGYDELLKSMMEEVHAGPVDVYSLKIFENGVRGRIHNETVYLGSYAFMMLEGFNPPQQAARDSLFLAIDQRLAGEIVIHYQIRHGASGAFRHLQHEPGLYTMVAARNFLITPAYIGQNFKTGIAKIVCLKAANRRKLAGASALEKSTVCGYIFREGITSYGLVTAGARRTWRAGFWMSVLSVVTAVILMIRTALTLLQGLAIPTGTGLITLNLILLLVCELISRLSAGNSD